jgi:hypothetical protein
MTERAEIVYFPKLCAHGVPMRWVQHMSGRGYWEGRTESCPGCKASADAEAEAQEQDFEAFIQRIKDRVKPG